MCSVVIFFFFLWALCMQEQGLCAPTSIPSLAAAPASLFSCPCPPEPAVVVGSREAAAASVLGLGRVLGYSFPQFGVA